MVARRRNWRSCFHSPDSSVERCLKTTLEYNGSGRGWRAPPVAGAIERGGLWRMAFRFQPKLSNCLNLRTDCDLDCLPLSATRNCHGNFHPVRDRVVGDAPWLRPVRQGNGKSVASRRAMVDSSAVNYGDGAFRRYGRATAH